MATDARPRHARRPGRGPLERLYAATTALSAALEDEPGLVRRIAVELATLLDARYAAVGLLGEDGHLIAFETTGLTVEEEEVLRPQPPHGRGILRALLHEGQPLRLDDLTRDPRSVGFPPGHPPMRAFLGVPLMVGGRVLGRLYVTERRGGPDGVSFTAEDETLALGFAAAAAVAIQSARQTAQLVRAERLRAAGELAVGVAHDFNNLLATILGRAEVLLGQVRDREQRESLEAIQRAARDGAATVARMREYGRPVDADEFRPVDLGDLAREAVELTRPRWQNEAQREGRTIEVRLDLGTAPLAQADPAALREVLVNLLFNAFDAQPAGGTVTVAVRPAEDGPSSVDVRAGAGVSPPTGSTPAWVELTVADTGTGMSEDVRRRLFEPFFTTKGMRGSGLGLAMVRKVVDSHGGTIAVETTPGEGTIFRLRLPPAPAPAAAPEAAAVETAEGAIPSARIVVVDDQQDVLETLSMLLRRDGHDVRAFRDPRAAVDAVLAECPDVLLTDLGMPGLSGWDVARLTRARWPALPVILLTGWGRDVSPGQLREHGVLLTLAKPAELPALRGALGRALLPAETAPLEILLVDDSTAFATVLGVLLGQGGHRVRRVEWAAAAVEVLRGHAPVDLVILDLNLPDRPSTEVLRAARARPRGPAVCVVSGSDPASMETGAPGADLYVEKAYVPEQLERIYATARGRHAGGA